jgi:hypothetical protein
MALPSRGCVRAGVRFAGRGSQFLDGGIDGEESPVGPQLGWAPARAQTADTHTQAVTTAAPKARLSQPTWFPDAIPAKPAKKTTPVTQGHR